MATSVKHHSCPQCPYKTTLILEMKSHIMTHNLSMEERFFNCADPIKSFKCHECDYETLRSSFLESHINSKHSRFSEIECENCNHKSRDFSELERHLRLGCPSKTTVELSKFDSFGSWTEEKTAGTEEKKSLVDYILKNRPLTYDDKVSIKTRGRPVPVLTIKKTTASQIRQFHRYFKKQNTYDKFLWMCGCSERNKLFCFICLLSNSLQPSPWIQGGVDDLQHLKERAIKHEKSTIHLHNLVDYNVLGKTEFPTQLDSTSLQNIRTHNERVDRNRHILRRLIMCIKFCGAFERDGALNPGIFRGLVDFTSELDSLLSVHLNESTMFKDTSETIQNELLDAILEVCRTEIQDQITKSNFLAIEVEETTDSFNQQQLVVIFRYIFDGEIFERFWKFIRPESYTAAQIAHVLMEQLDHLHIPTNKLIAQSYDGAAVMSGKTSGVQSLIRQKYHSAFYVHRYAHQFKPFLQQAASCDRKMKIFFAEVQAFTSFFSGSTKRIELLDEIAKQRQPKPVAARWKFKTRAVNTLYEEKFLIRECLERIIIDIEDSKTIAEASGLLNTLNSEEFNYFLEVTHYIIPHVEIFFKQIQSHEANSVYIKECLKKFELQISNIGQKIIDQLQLGEEMDTQGSGSEPIRATNNASEINRRVAKKYCDVITSQMRNIFDFTGHMSAAKLFSPDSYLTFKKKFPEDIFKETTKSYSFLNKERLRTELTVMYQRDDMRTTGVLPLFNFFSKNNLQDGFSELYKLSEIICATPTTTTTTKCGRSFSTLKRIKSFLRNTVGQEKLNALAMLSIEKQLVQSIPDFDSKVINIFSNTEERRIDFNYK